MDICPACWEDIATLVRRHYKAVQRGLVCDLTGQLMTGDYEYYNGEVTKATVQAVGGRYSVQPTPKFVELVVSPAAYAQLHDRRFIGAKGAGIWSSDTASSRPGPSGPSPNTTRTGR